MESQKKLSDLNLMSNMEIHIAEIHLKTLSSALLAIHLEQSITKDTYEWLNTMVIGVLNLIPEEADFREDPCSEEAE